MAMEQKYGDLARSRPLSPAVLGELGALTGLAPPRGAFDPAGAWEQTWRIWAVSGAELRAQLGYLRIRREPDEAGKSVTLSVEKRLNLNGGDAYLTRADIECAADALVSPTAWTVESVVLGTDGEPVEVTAVRESVEVRDDTLHVTAGDKTLVRDVGGPLTTDWGLFDVVQRLPLSRTAPLEFTVLEELDLPKARQRLSYRGTGEVELEGEKLGLSCYQMIGEGLLPYLYWVDEHRRLLMAISHTRAYIYDPEAEARVAEAAETLARRQRQ
jgi:hypothetical protein